MAKTKRVVREVSAGGVVFRRFSDQTIRFLIIRDSYNKWGLPKGHLESSESPAEAAIRETGEEVGLRDLILHGPIRIIDWRFRTRGGKLVHKFCHFFLLESADGEPSPELDEGITAVRWCPLEEALSELSYDNARGVVRRAGEMTLTLYAREAELPREMPRPIAPS
ncbi:MAG TPA: NUDIX hydrolase [Gemmatimonadales bacterium]